MMQAPDKLLLSTLKSSALKDYVEETKLIALQVMEMASSAISSRRNSLDVSNITYYDGYVYWLILYGKIPIHLSIQCL